MIKDFSKPVCIAGGRQKRPQKAQEEKKEPQVIENSSNEEESCSQRERRQLSQFSGGSNNFFYNEFNQPAESKKLNEDNEPNQMERKDKMKTARGENSSQRNTFKNSLKDSAKFSKNNSLKNSLNDFVATRNVKVPSSPCTSHKNSKEKNKSNNYKELTYREVFNKIDVEKYNKAKENRKKQLANKPNYLENIYMSASGDVNKYLEANFHNINLTGNASLYENKKLPHKDKTISEIKKYQSTFISRIPGIRHNSPKELPSSQLLNLTPIPKKKTYKNFNELQKEDLKKAQRKAVLSRVFEYTNALSDKTKNKKKIIKDERYNGCDQKIAYENNISNINLEEDVYKKYDNFSSEQIKSSAKTIQRWWKLMRLLGKVKGGYDKIIKKATKGSSNSSSKKENLIYNMSNIQNIFNQRKKNEKKKQKKKNKLQSQTPMTNDNYYAEKEFDYEKEEYNRRYDEYYGVKPKRKDAIKDSNIKYRNNSSGNDKKNKSIEVKKNSNTAVKAKKSIKKNINGSQKAIGNNSYSNSMDDSKTNNSIDVNNFNVNGDMEAHENKAKFTKPESLERNDPIYMSFKNYTPNTTDEIDKNNLNAQINNPMNMNDGIGDNVIYTIQDYVSTTNEYNINDNNIINDNEKEIKSDNESNTQKAIDAFTGAEESLETNSHNKESQKIIHNENNSRLFIQAGSSNNILNNDVSPETQSKNSDECFEGSFHDKIIEENFIKTQNLNTGVNLFHDILNNKKKQINENTFYYLINCLQNIINEIKPEKKAANLKDKIQEIKNKNVANNILEISKEVDSISIKAFNNPMKDFISTITNPIDNNNLRNTERNPVLSNRGTLKDISNAKILQKEKPKQFKGLEKVSALNEEINKSEKINKKYISYKIEKYNLLYTSPIKKKNLEQSSLNSMTIAKTPKQTRDIETETENKQNRNLSIEKKEINIANHTPKKEFSNAENQANIKIFDNLHQKQNNNINIISKIDRESFGAQTNKANKFADLLCNQGNSFSFGGEDVKKNRVEYESEEQQTSIKFKSDWNKELMANNSNSFFLGKKVYNNSSQQYEDNLEIRENMGKMKLIKVTDDECSQTSLKFGSNPSEYSVHNKSMNFIAKRKGNEGVKRSQSLKKIYANNIESSVSAYKSLGELDINLLKIIKLQRKIKEFLLYKKKFSTIVHKPQKNKIKKSSTYGMANANLFNNFDRNEKKYFSKGIYIRLNEFLFDDVFSLFGNDNKFDIESFISEHISISIKSKNKLYYLTSSSNKNFNKNKEEKQKEKAAKNNNNNKINLCISKTTLMTLNKDSKKQKELNNQLQYGGETSKKFSSNGGDKKNKALLKHGSKKSSLLSDKRDSVNNNKLDFKFLFNDNKNIYNNNPFTDRTSSRNLKQNDLFSKETYKLINKSKIDNSNLSRNNKQNNNNLKNSKSVYYNKTIFSKVKNNAIKKLNNTKFKNDSRLSFSKNTINTSIKFNNSPSIRNLKYSDKKDYLTNSEKTNKCLEDNLDNKTFDAPLSYDIKYISNYNDIELKYCDKNINKDYNYIKKIIPDENKKKSFSFKNENFLNDLNNQNNTMSHNSTLNNNNDSNLEPSSVKKKFTFEGMISPNDYKINYKSHLNNSKNNFSYKRKLLTQKKQSRNKSLNNEILLDYHSEESDKIIKVNKRERGDSNLTNNKVNKSKFEQDSLCSDRQINYTTRNIYNRNISFDSKKNIKAAKQVIKPVHISYITKSNYHGIKNILKKIKLIQNQFIIYSRLKKYNNTYLKKSLKNQQKKYVKIKKYTKRKASDKKTEESIDLDDSNLNKTKISNPNDRASFKKVEEAYHKTDINRKAVSSIKNRKYSSEYFNPNNNSIAELLIKYKRDTCVQNMPHFLTLKRNSEDYTNNKNNLSVDDALSKTSKKARYHILKKLIVDKDGKIDKYKTTGKKNSNYSLNILIKKFFINTIIRVFNHKFDKYFVDIYNYKTFKFLRNQELVKTINKIFLKKQFIKWFIRSKTSLYVKKNLKKVSKNVKKILPSIITLINKLCYRNYHEFFYRLALIALINYGVKFNNNFIMSFLNKGFYHGYLNLIKNILELKVTNNYFEKDAQNNFFKYIKRLSNIHMKSECSQIKSKIILLNDDGDKYLSEGVSENNNLLFNNYSKNKHKDYNSITDNENFSDCNSYFINSNRNSISHKDKGINSVERIYKRKSVRNLNSTYDLRNKGIKKLNLSNIQNKTQNNIDSNNNYFSGSLSKNEALEMIPIKKKFTVFTERNRSAFKFPININNIYDREKNINFEGNLKIINNNNNYKTINHFTNDYRCNEYFNSLNSSSQKNLNNVYNTNIERNKIEHFGQELFPDNDLEERLSMLSKQNEDSKIITRNINFKK